MDISIKKHRFPTRTLEVFFPEQKMFCFIHPGRVRSDIARLTDGQFEQVWEWARHHLFGDRWHHFRHELHQELVRRDREYASRKAYQEVLEETSKWFPQLVSP